MAVASLLSIRTSYSHPLDHRRTSPAFVLANNTHHPIIKCNQAIQPSALCESNSSCEEGSRAFVPNVSQHCHYEKLNPEHIERTSLHDTHAVFGTLYGDGYIERYDVYRRVPTEDSNKKEIVAIDLQIGHRLNGHDKIVHGGIISLLIDEAMGWAAYETLEHYNSNIDAQYHSLDTLLVTANLNIDFRAPFVAGSKAVLRVYLDHEMTNGRKMYFVAQLESYDGVVFADAKSLFLCVSADKMSNEV